jgi:ankyrin repeat protein
MKMKAAAMIAALSLLSWTAFASGGQEIGDSVGREKKGSAAVASEKTNSTQFLEVAATGTPQQIQAALSGGADVNASDKDGTTALMYAAQKNENPEVISILLKAGADIEGEDKDGDTALMWAARSTRNPEVVMTLLKAGADAMEKDLLGKKALSYAALNANLKDTDAFRQLLKASQ